MAAPQAPAKTPAPLTETAEEAADPKPVTSSMISEISWDEEEEMLTVVFNNGHEEEYPASKEQWQGLLNAPSKGKYMWEEIF